jgi:hypothetical protein
LRNLFFEEVKASGLSHNKATFARFYLTYLQPALNAGKAAQKLLVKELVTHPYAFTFGCFLATDYSQRIKDFKDCPNQEGILKDCLSGLKPFDMFRVWGTQIPTEDLAFLNDKRQKQAEVVSFCAGIKKKESQLHDVHSHIQKL